MSDYKRLSREERLKESERVRNGERRTHAKVDEDRAFRMLLVGNEPPQFGDYPEYVLDALRKFVKIFEFPSRAIPYKRNSSQFKMWITQFDQIQTLCGKELFKAMKLAKEKIDSLPYNYIIDKPIRIKPFLIDALKDIELDSNRLDNLQNNPDTNIPTISPESESVKNLKTFMKSLKED